MGRFKLTLEYEGTRYSGWQIQKGGKTVQGEVTDACRNLFGTSEFELFGAGRTDSGVHARGQVAHLDADTELPLLRIKYGINDRLPPDISILSVEEAAPGFHARHDAFARSYIYQISRRRTAFAKKFVWWIKDELDLTGMFYGYDTTVIKVFFTAAIVALTGSQVLDYLGILDLEMVFVNEYLVYAAVIGGIIMGAGFIMGGFCPGTGLAALSIGKVDAMFFVAGGLTGAFLFAETYPLIQGLAEGNNKGPVKINEVLGLQPGLFTLLLIIAAVVMFWIAEKAETRFRRPDIANEI